MSDTPHIIDVTDSDFNDVVIKGSSTTPVLVDFWATWCRPCKMMAPVLDEIAAGSPDSLTVAKVDVGQFQELGSKYQITSIPAMLVFVDGEPVKTIVGAQSKASLRRELDQYL